MIGLDLWQNDCKRTWWGKVVHLKTAGKGGVEEEEWGSGQGENEKDLLKSARDFWGIFLDLNCNRHLYTIYLLIYGGGSGIRD